LALDVWRAYGGPLTELRRLIERERKASARDRAECPDSVPLLSLESPAVVPQETGQTRSVFPQTPFTAGEVAFEIPQSIRTALRKSPILGSAKTLWKPDYWRAQIRAFPSLDYGRVILDAEAYLQSNPARRPRKRIGTFMTHQFERARERAE